MGKRNKKKKVYKCEICEGIEDDKPVIACDKCDKWHHFSCVGIKTIGKNDTWFCPLCKANRVDMTSPSRDQQNENLTSPSNVQQNVPQISTQQNPTTAVIENLTLPSNDQRNAERISMNRELDRQSQHRSTSSRNTCTSRVTRSRRDIELEIIEEERVLQEKRDQHYLVQKYRVLMQSRESDKQSVNSHTSQHTGSAYTKIWVDRQSDLLPNKNVESSTRMNVLSKLNEVGFENTSTPVKGNTKSRMQDNNQQEPYIEDYHSAKSKSSYEKPTKTFTPEVKINQSRCEYCKMVDDEKKLHDCLLCFNPCHYTCMDLIWIDELASWICYACKNPTQQRKENYQSKPEKELHRQLKQPKQVTEGAVKRIINKELHCDICGLDDNHKSFKPCDICDKLFHFVCMEIASIDNKIVWTCNKCAPPEIASSKGSGSQMLLPTVPQQNFKLPNQSPSIQRGISVEKASREPKLPEVQQQPLPGLTLVKTLTPEQIASRHVVTKDLPIYDGKPEEWPMFISRFNNSTGLCGFSDSENLDRLQKCLKGNAKDAVQSRLLTAEAVPGIISTLKMLYGRPELIVEALMKKIRDAPPPKEDKLNTLVDFALAVQNVCATLEQAELQDHLTNPSLIKELVDKLPSHFKVQWAIHKATIQNITLSTLGTFLYGLATVISTVTEPSAPKERKNGNKSKKDSNHENKDNKSKPKQSHHEDKGSVYVHSENKPRYEPEKKPSQCIICEKRCQRVENCLVFLSYDVDKRWKEMYNHKLCRKCLERHGRFCNQNKNCGINGCVFKHHSLLHDEKKHSKEAVEDKPNSTVASNHAHKSLSRNVLLRIVPVKIHYKDRTLNTFAYQDDGSDITMVEASLMKELEIRGTLQPLCLLWTVDIHRKEHESRCVKFEISGQNEFSERYILNDVRTVETLGLPKQTVIKDELLRKFPYLKNASLIDYQEAIPQILIGSDNASLNCQLKIIEGELNQPIASKTRIGWSIHGRTDNRYSNEEVVIVNYHRIKCPCQQQADEKIHQQIKDYFTVGVQASNVNLCSKEDEKALEMLKKFTKRVGDRYETGLLWRYDRVNLPDSYGMAKKRLQCLEKHKPKMINSINDTIQDYIAKGYVSKLTVEELKQQNDKIWYLPIFAVTYPKKPDKIRTVFDAAAKVNGISLNSLLLKGPDQLASLLDILRRFREKRIAATGDIKEMFHQVRIRDEDKQAQRFLWRNGDTSKEPDQYVMNVMTFGATCSPSAAQFVKNLNANEFEYCLQFIHFRFVTLAIDRQHINETYNPSAGHSIKFLSYLIVNSEALLKMYMFFS